MPVSMFNLLEALCLTVCQLGSELSSFSGQGVNHTVTAPLSIFIGVLMGLFEDTTFLQFCVGVQLRPTNHWEQWLTLVSTFQRLKTTEYLEG